MELEYKFAMLGFNSCIVLLFVRSSLLKECRMDLMLNLKKILLSHLHLVFLELSVYLERKIYVDILGLILPSIIC